MLTSIYFVMPVGRLSWRHALIGGVSATVLWEISRHVLVWYLATLSQVQTVYGSLTTAIVVLLSLELAAIVLLFGAQVIAEYERIEWEPVARPPRRCIREPIEGAGRRRGGTKRAPDRSTTTPFTSGTSAHLAQAPQQLVLLVRLAEEALDAELGGAIAMLVGGARRDHDDRDRRGLRDRP